ncbi:MAG TPA: hypothetical protein DDX99_08915 [Desulfofustis sp.]|nr:hypothetical protein [Desulfofustis sp.]HBH32894.1 hypothetical protein [Desulfofustis sp.]
MLYDKTLPGIGLSGITHVSKPVTTIITTPAQENYVEAIYTLSLKGPVRSSALAETLGVKRASVSKFITGLVASGLVTHLPRKEITLTTRGVALAHSIARRKRCLTRLLVDICNMAPADADGEIHRLEHVLSDEVLHRLETLVEFGSSSSGWLKRLHLRMAADPPHTAEHMAVGSSLMHQGERQQSE